MQDVAGKYHGLRLWLPLTTHGAVRHHAPIAKSGKRRLDRVERSATGFQGVVMGRIQRKAGAAILPGDACIFQNNSAAKLPINALNEADRAT